MTKDSLVSQLQGESVVIVFYVQQFMLPYAKDDVFQTAFIIVIENVTIDVRKTKRTSLTG